MKPDQKDGKTMIPKTIHYCYFGGNPLPPLAETCIESWQKYCPDFEIIRWDEGNYTLDSNPYIKEATTEKKWAFVSDYFRLDVLYNYGGIYMDTDVELIKPINEFLNHSAFSGFESKNGIPTGIIGAVKGNGWIEFLLNDYSDRHFIFNGKLDYSTNVETITRLTKERYPLILNNTFQDLKDVVFYPTNYFCPMYGMDNNIIIEENTYCIHHFAASWLPEELKRIKEKQSGHIKRYGKFIGKSIYYYSYIVYLLKNEGISGVINAIKTKRARL